MSELTRFRVSGGEPVVVETDTPGGAAPVGARRRIRDAEVEFTERLGPIRDAVAATLRTLRGSLGPDEIKVSFGVTMSAEAGAVVARTALQGTFQVEMVWARDDRPADPPPPEPESAPTRPGPEAA
jgi:hypothetical protein